MEQIIKNTIINKNNINDTINGLDKIVYKEKKYILRN